MGLNNIEVCVRNSLVYGVINGVVNGVIKRADILSALNN
jgi:hypothetical protein